MAVLELNVGKGQKRKFQFVWKCLGEPDESFLTDNSRVTASIYSRYLERLELIDALTGFSYVTKESGKWVLRRITPLPYPYHHGLRCAGAPRVSGRSSQGVGPGITLPFPMGQKAKQLASIGQPTYVAAEINLLFTTIPYKIKEDSDVLSQDPLYLNLPDEGDSLKRGVKRYISRVGRPAGKLISIPGNYLYYKASGRPVLGSSASFFQPAMDITYTWHQVPEDALPIDAWMLCSGAVNDLDFDGWPAETLLFQQASFRTTTSPFGLQQCDVTYTFRFLPNFYDPTFFGVTKPAKGHNWFPTVGQTAVGNYPADPVEERGKLIFREVCTRGTTQLTPLVGGNPTPNSVPVVPLNGSPPYRLADFRNLFRPKQSGPEIPEQFLFPG